MKFMLATLAFVSYSAFALPIVCESYEKTNEHSSLRIKINDKVAVRQNGSVWDLYLIGVTSQGPDDQPRTKMYGQGRIRPESVSMTIVKDSAVYGYVDIKSTESNGTYEGIIRIGGILRGRIIDVRCTDENP